MAPVAASSLKSFQSVPGLSKFFFFSAKKTLTKDLMTEGLKHPRMFRAWLGRPQIVATHPDVAREILKRPADFRKSQQAPPTFGKPIGDRLSPGVIVMDNGEKWMKLRKPLDPAFETKALRAIVPKFCEASQQLVDQWRRGGVVDAKRDMSRFALDVLGAAVLGRSFGAMDGTFDDTYAKYVYVMSEMVNPLYMVFPSLEQLPFPRNIKYREGIEHMRALLSEAVDVRLEERRRKLEEGIEEEFKPKDMLDMVLGPGLRTDAVVPEGKLLEILWIFFIAGHDTTAISLTWLMDFLAHHPEVQQKAREEALATLDGATDPTADMLEDVPYISAVINEGLRLRPPVYHLLTREATDDTELDGVLIPKGTGVSIHIGAVNRHPDAYDDPDAFLPERFLAKKEKGAKGPRIFNNLAFSAGPRRCLGDKFSLLEQKALLIKLLATCEVLPKDGASAQTEYDAAALPIIFLQPKEMFVQVRPLQA